MVGLKSTKTSSAARLSISLLVRLHKCRNLYPTQKAYLEKQCTRDTMSSHGYLSLSQFKARKGHRREEDTSVAELGLSRMPLRVKSATKMVAS